MAGQPQFILNSVIELTQQRQIIPLATSLVNTVAQTLNAEWAAIIDVRTDRILAYKGETPKWQWHALVKSCQQEQQLLVDDALGIAVAIPIFSNQNVSHVLYVVSSSLGLTQQYLLNGFARIYENFLGLVHESESDSLTSLLNKKAYISNIEKMIEQAKTLEPCELQPVFPWLAIFDIDHFKMINDSLGHLYGDEILLQLSNVMMTTFAGTDVLFRFGGDEFVVLLSPRTKQDADAMFRRFKANVHGLRNDKLPTFSISIGISQITEATNPNQLVADADKALYYVKEHGRDNYCFFGDLIRDSKIAATIYPDDIELF
ncbi:MAG: GGDEF domain-containing protein [Shewanella sp.]